jgi:hypothetical protein
MSNKTIGSCSIHPHAAEVQVNVIYIAGPLSTGCFDAGNGGVFNAYRWERNVRRAEQLMIDLTLEGFAVICVHTGARHCFGYIPEHTALEADFELVRRSDAVALVEGWNLSSGTLKEIALAEQLGKPIAGKSCPYTGGARGRAIAVELRDLLKAGGGG